MIPHFCLTLSASRLFMSMRTWSTSSLLIIAYGAGCLSLDVVPRSASDRPRDDFDASTDGALVDGGPEPCFDRGSLNAEHQLYELSHASCEGELSCVAGECVPLQRCMPGTLQECGLTVEDVRGSISAFKLEGDHIYWLESGTTDERSNPRNDGVLRRTRIGEWVPELVASGLDLFDDASRQFAQFSLETTPNSVLWWSYLRPAGYVSGLNPASIIASVQEGAKGVVQGTLANQHGPGTWSLNGQAAYYSGSQGVWRVALDGTGDELQVLSTGVTFCRMLGQRWLHCIDDVRFVPLRIALDNRGWPAGPPEELAPDLSHLFANTSHYFRVLNDGWIGRAPILDGAFAPEWPAVAGPGNVVSADQDYVYWVRDFSGGVSLEDWPSVGREEKIVLRTRADGSGSQETIAEMFEPFFYGVDVVGELQVNASGTLWRRSSSQLHFVPMPPVTN